MEINNLAKKVQKAKEAVEGLDEPLKTEAFKKILDKLLEPEPQNLVSIPEPIMIENTKRFQQAKQVSKSKPRKQNKSNLEIKAEVNKRKRALADMINRTEYSEIHKLDTTLMRSLYVLNIMREKGEDGLTPPEISFILTEVFRIKARPEAVSVALKDAHKYVDRDRIVVGRATAYIYKIMKPGEDYLSKEIRKINSHVNKADEGRTPDSS